MIIKLKEVRVQKDLSQKELEELSGVSDTHISAIESGKRMPTLPTICRLARALGVKPEELYACEENINGEMANDVET